MTSLILQCVPLDGFLKYLILLKVEFIMSFLLLTIDQCEDRRWSHVSKPPIPSPSPSKVWRGIPKSVKTVLTNQSVCVVRNKQKYRDPKMYLSKFNLNVSFWHYFIRHSIFDQGHIITSLRATSHKTCGTDLHTIRSFFHSLICMCILHSLSFNLWLKTSPQ